MLPCFFPLPPVETWGLSDLLPSTFADTWSHAPVDTCFYVSMLHCFYASLLHPSRLRFAAAVVRDRRHILDRHHVQPVRVQSAHRGLTSHAHAFDKNIHIANTGYLGLFHRIAHNHGRGVWRSFFRALEAHKAGTGKTDCITDLIRNRHNGIVVSGLDIRTANRHLLD